MRNGIMLGAGAYLAWGASALYWPLLVPAGPTEILAVRAVTSSLLLGLVVTLLRRWRPVRVLVGNRRQLRLLTVAAALIAVNWGTFIYATTSGQVIEAALGYFISPLVMVALGVLAFGDRPSRRQWLAVGLGAAGVVVLVAAYGRTPWIALTLAVTFGLYALVKKRAAAHAVDGLTVETAVLLVPAAGYLLALKLAGTAQLGQISTGHTLLMLGSGLVMVVPLALFAAAANRLPLTSVGLLQYLEPIVQFLIGLLIFAESMPGPRWAAFALVWLAIMVLVGDGRRPARAARWVDRAPAGVRGWRRSWYPDPRCDRSPAA